MMVANQQMVAKMEPTPEYQIVANPDGLSASGPMVANPTQDAGGQKLAAAETAGTGGSAGNSRRSRTRKAAPDTPASGSTSGGGGLSATDYVDMLQDIAAQADEAYRGLVDVVAAGEYVTITLRLMVAKVQDGGK